MILFQNVTTFQHPGNTELLRDHHIKISDINQDMPTTSKDLDHQDFHNSLQGTSNNHPLKALTVDYVI